MTHGRIDEIDQKILNVLQEDGRIDVVLLAKRVNLSRTPVHERIRKLQEAGFIRGIVALLDRTKVGKPVLVIVHVKLREQTMELLTAFEVSTMAMSEVQFVLHVSGGWDFILHITASTPQDYYLFLMERICGLPNVAHVESSFVMKECKNNGPFIL